MGFRSKIRLDASEGNQAVFEVSACLVYLFGFSVNSFIHTVMFVQLQGSIEVVLTRPY